jgi:hypothetical protein
MTSTLSQPVAPVISQGSRICIAGLNASTTATVRQVLMELGAEGSSFRPGSDAIVLPDNASEEDRSEALSQGFAVFSVSERGIPLATPRDSSTSASIVFS